ncbi:MAG: 2,3-diaminopropionate biosynthesis protein SbnA [Acidobacteriota bacterium]
MSTTCSSSQELLRRIDKLGRLMRPTPLVAVASPGVRLFAKLEYMNPVGSVKDRTAYWILRRAAERGDIDERTTVIESSSGNFALALATYARLLDLRFIPVIDPNILPTYESFLRRNCQTVVKVEEADDSGGFLKTRLHTVQKLCASIDGAYWTNQYANLDGMDAHYRLTAEEICRDLPTLDFAFIGVSSGGTIAGMSRRLKERYPNVKVIAVDAAGSIIFGGPARKRHIPGLGAGIVPPLLSRALIDDVVIVSETTTARACHELLWEHGLFVGGSSGTSYAAAQHYAPRMRPDATAVFLCTDRGVAYMDTVFNAEWVRRLE